MTFSLAPILTEALHPVGIRGDVGNGERLQLQHDGGGSCCGGEIDESLALQGMVGEIEAPKVDVIVRHVDALAGSLGMKGKGEQKA